MLGLQPMVSDHDATDKTPMCEMPLIFMFEVLGLEAVKGLGITAVSGHNAMDKTLMYEMQLMFVFGGWESIFCIGVLGVGISSLAFCPEITADGLFWAPISVLYLEYPLREQGVVLSVFLKTKESLSHLQWK